MFRILIWGDIMDYKVLLIDDDKDLSFIISETISKYGYNVVLAYSEEMAYEILEKKKFDVIILDINLPDSSGFKICNEIRKNSQVPIIFASARSSVSDRIDSLNLGGDF
jgi:two-component system response regulator VicR